MLGYALLIYSARALRLRDDQSGDNLYYMGFLFTLTSLGVSLYQFTASRAAEEIVQNFGIAIGSTSMGVMTERSCAHRKVGGEVLCQVW